MKNSFKLKISERFMEITPDGEKKKVRQIINKYNVLQLHRIWSCRLPVHEIHCDFCKSRFVT